YFYGVALADREWGLNNADRAEQILDDCPEEPRGWEWHYLKRLCHLDLLTLRHPGRVMSVAFSPDGGRLAATGKSAMVWDAATGKEILTIHSVYSIVAFSPDGGRLITTWRHVFGKPAPIKAKVHDAATGRQLPALDGLP